MGRIGITQTHARRHGLQRSREKVGFATTRLQSGLPSRTTHRAIDGQHLVWCCPFCTYRHHPTGHHLGAPVWLGKAAGHKAIIRLFQRFDQPSTGCKQQLAGFDMPDPSPGCGLHVYRWGTNEVARLQPKTGGSHTLWLVPTGVCQLLVRPGNTASITRF
jgi:hypothetical protein